MTGPSDDSVHVVVSVPPSANASRRRTTPSSAGGGKLRAALAEAYSEIGERVVADRMRRKSNERA